MRFGEIVRYEIEHHVRSPLTWIFAVIMFGLAFLMMSGGGAPGPGINANAPFQLAFVSVMLGLFGMAVSAAIFSDAATRDLASEMDPLLFTCPVRKAEYLGGRLVAALTTNALILFAIPLGLAMPQLLGLNDPTAMIGPFRAAAYLQPWLVLLLPNVLLSGAVLFTIGMLAGHAVPVFIGAIGLSLATLFTLGPAGEGVHPVLSVLAPFGFHTVSEVTEYWTPAERNARLIGVPTMLLWNRLIWLALAAVVLGMLHRRFRFAHRGTGTRRGRRRRTIEDTGAQLAPVTVPRVPGAFGVRTTFRQTLAVARGSLAEVIGSRSFLAVLLACLLLTMILGANVDTSVFDASTWPVTLLMIGPVLSSQVNLLVYLLIALYAGELVWRQREVGAAEVADAAPVTEGVALVGRFVALVVILLTLQASIMVGGILSQALQGYYDFEIGLYLRVLFGLKLADYAIMAVLAMTIQVVVNNKYLGHMIVILVFGLIHLAGSLGLRQKLLVYGTDPGWIYSDMNGFGPFVGPFVWFKLYWAACGVLLALVAVLFWVRGREHGLRSRFREARARLTVTTIRMAGTSAFLILLLGGFILSGTGVSSELGDRGRRQATYEQRYSRFRHAPQPTITTAVLRTEIYSDPPAVTLNGNYTLRNRTEQAIDSVHVYLDTDVEARSLSLDRNADAVLVDAETGYRIFALQRPLDPGDSLQVTFDVVYRPRRFAIDGLETHVVRNGAHFDRRWLPFIGYQPMFELRDEEARARFGLAARVPLPRPEEADARRHRDHRVHVDAVIGTSAEQIAITPGVLRRSWVENERHYFHYQTVKPVEFGGTVFSARYALLEDRWNDVELQIFHHPSHDYNLDRMVRSMKASLDYFTAQFGPYADSQLRIVEFPRYGGVGRAGPHTIAFAEDIFLSRVREGEVDQPFYGTAHEAAHQWWGGQVRGAPVRGHALLSESLANYSAMMVMERTYGPQMTRRVYNFHLERYLRGRGTQAREVPLLEVTDQAHISYRKGAIAMYTLRAHIGEDAVNSALRRYLEKYRDADQADPTSRDLYAELRAVTPDSLRYVLTDWFETITLWDVSIEQAVVEPAGAGEYVVRLDVMARKMRADSVGNETDVPMDDMVEIGVFTGGPPIDTDLNLAFDQHGDAIYLQRHRIRTGRQTIRITVPREPVRAGIDPFRALIERRGSDNVIGVRRVP